VAAAQSSLYEELQAAYLFNFAKYVKWPAEHDTFVIGIYGEPGNIDFLRSTLETKKIRGKAVEVRVLTTVEGIEKQAISMIYVPESGTKYFGTLLHALAGKSILIVTEKDMIKKGAMISFIVEDDKLRFKLKKSALDEVELVASDGLLKLAIVL
jgi:hypothetical protein